MASQSEMPNEGDKSAIGQASEQASGKILSVNIKTLLGTPAWEFDIFELQDFRRRLEGNDLAVSPSDLDGFVPGVSKVASANFRANYTREPSANFQRRMEGLLTSLVMTIRLVQNGYEDVAELTLAKAILSLYLSHRDFFWFASEGDSEIYTQSLQRIFAFAADQTSRLSPREGSQTKQFFARALKEENWPLVAANLRRLSIQPRSPGIDTLWTPGAMVVPTGILAASAVLGSALLAAPIGTEWQALAVSVWAAANAIPSARLGWILGRDALTRHRLRASREASRELRDLCARWLLLETKAIPSGRETSP